MTRRLARPVLTADQQAEAERLLVALRQATEADLRALAEQLASTTDATLFGADQLAVRDIVLGRRARTVETALAERKIRGYDGSTRGCPTCPGGAEFQRW